MSSIARLFLGTSPTVAGESEDAGFKGKIELDSWEWALERKQTTKDKVAQASTPGEKKPVHPEPSTFRFTKSMDKSTTPLLNKLKSGEAFLATLTLIEDSDLWFEMSVYLYGARVIKYNMNGKDDPKGGQIDESWVLNYDYIYFEQTSQPMAKTPKTVTSNHLRRTASASTESPDTVKKVVDSFSALKSPEKVEALAQIGKKFPDEIKGQLSAEPPKTSPKVQEVVKAFQSLSPADQQKALGQMK